MKVISLFFQLFAEYQRRKYNYKMQYEAHKLECAVKYLKATGKYVPWNSESQI